MKGEERFDNIISTLEKKLADRRAEREKLRTQLELVEREINQIVDTTTELRSMKTEFEEEGLG